MKWKSDVKLQNHLWFWGVYFTINFLSRGAYFDDYAYSLQSNLIEFSLNIPLVYFNLFVLIPHYVLKSKYIKYIFGLVVSIFVIYLVKTALSYYIMPHTILLETNSEYKPFEINHIIAVCMDELYVVAVASSVYLTFAWLRERKKNQSLRENQFKMKLKYLENQIRPHFFFNTLNNLYALSLESSDKVPDLIIKLSELMEYVLYDIKEKKFVTLLQEIDNIHNYVEIEKLRFENVEFRINLESDMDEIEIPPLILISLIENAFKHGGFNNPNLKIKINCKIIDNKLLYIEVLNNFVHSQKPVQKKGIGLENTQKRLKLIYKNKYLLEQKTKLNYYIIRLQIPVNK